MEEFWYLLAYGPFIFRRYSIWGNSPSLMRPQFTSHRSSWHCAHKPLILKMLKEGLLSIIIGVDHATISKSATPRIDSCLHSHHLSSISFLASLKLMRVPHWRPRNYIIRENIWISIWCRTHNLIHWWFCSIKSSLRAMYLGWAEFHCCVWIQVISSIWLSVKILVYGSLTLLSLIISRLLNCYILIWHFYIFWWNCSIDKVLEVWLVLSIS